MTGVVALVSMGSSHIMHVSLHSSAAQTGIVSLLLRINGVLGSLGM